MNKRILTKSLAIALLFVMAIGHQPGMAQCGDKNIRKTIKAMLESYIFETASSQPFNSFAAPRGTIDAAFTVYAEESYRFVNICQGFAGPVEFSIFDSERKLVYSNSKDVKNPRYDFTAAKTGEYVVRFKVAEESNANACVAFAVGYK